MPKVLPFFYVTGYYRFLCRRAKRAIHLLFNFVSSSLFSGNLREYISNKNRDKILYTYILSLDASLIFINPSICTGTIGAASPPPASGASYYQFPLVTTRKVTSHQKNRTSISIFSLDAVDLYVRTTSFDSLRHEEEDVHSTYGKLFSRS